MGHDGWAMVKKLADAAKKAAAKHAERHAEKRAARNGDAAPGAPEGLRERKKSRTYDAIVEAAVELFEQKGFDATTVEEIAAAADVSPRTFFRYFDSKLDVVMPRKHASDELSLVEELAARPPEEHPIEAVRQVLRRDLKAIIDADPLAVRQLRVTMREPSLRARAFDHFQEHQAELLDVFATRLGMGPDALQAHLLAAAVGTAMWTVVDRWVAEGAAEDRLLPLLDEGFELLATGFDALGSRRTDS
jgi:AcrR family transcriptional regulator